VRCIWLSTAAREEGLSDTFSWKNEKSRDYTKDQYSAGPLVWERSKEYHVAGISPGKLGQGETGGGWGGGKDLRIRKRT